MEKTIINCIKNKIKGDPELMSELYSLILYGSAVRGDFIEGVSDIDFFAVLKGNDEILSSLRRILEDCTKNTGAVEVDLAWEFLENLDDPLNKGVPFKFLTVYQEDFLKNHVVIYGEDITEILPKYKFEELIKWRVTRLLKLSDVNRGNLKMLHITAGEVARLLALLNGAKTLKKEDILEVLQKIKDEDALSIYTSYLNKRNMSFDEEFLRSFIATRCNKILKRLELKTQQSQLQC
ncbi:nucleotidyltransferase domain-containing protein [Thermococcus aggregans]|uniref:Nucleotidyltransferase domain-containing protein n=1 Tax=Thermococcus aggregans TaxID=110163 RepID=A0A9E7SQ75_THEAG|nr:nucleotidyltransferase domain-containing protein [Thermococcus aggregans]USS41470.1 nucleotidyltransferase domain-containing protein [Thermococcus aggregans]